MLYEVLRSTVAISLAMCARPLRTTSTVIGLIGECTTIFFLSSLLDHRFRERISRKGAKVGRTEAFYFAPWRLGGRHSNPFVSSLPPPPATPNNRTPCPRAARR